MLTADHVVSAPPPIADRISFPNSTVLGTPPAAGATSQLLISQIFHGGFTGKEDLALTAVDYGKAPDDFFKSVVNLSYTTLIPNPTSDVKGTQFTSVGFGNTGTANTDAKGNLTGYTETARSSGIKRFQNNVFVSSAAGAVHNGYTYTDVLFTLDNPGVAGEGATFQADSGSPYFVSNDITLGGIPKVFTNTIVGVHAFGVNGTINVGQNDGGVLLTPDDIKWINKDLATLGCVPEPGALTLFGTGLAAVGVVAVRRRAAAAAAV